MFNRLKGIFINKEFFIFIIIGIINTFNGTVFAYIYSYAINTNLAFVCGYITSLVIAYVLNCKFIFQERLRINKLIKFGISYIPNFVIQNIIVVVGYNVMELPKVLVYGSAAILGIPITFMCVKLFAFKK